MTDIGFSELPEALRDRVEILYGWGRLTHEAHLFPKLKWLQTHTAGIDYLLDKPIWQGKVLLSTLNGVCSVPISEHSLAMMLAFHCKLPTMFEARKRSEWSEGRWDIFARPELRGSTLGIVGYGAIGRELARQAQGLGIRVLAVNRSGQRHHYKGYSQPGIGDPQASIPEAIYPTDGLLDFLPQCDHVVVLAPLTPANRHMFKAEAFVAMKSTAYFYNLARGALVDEAALVEALKHRQIAGAGLDVFEAEPLPPDSPLWGLDNVIISPHVSGFTLNYDELASDLFADNLHRYLAGESLLNQVERERGY